MSEQHHKKQGAAAASGDTTPVKALQDPAAAALGRGPEKSEQDAGYDPYRNAGAPPAHVHSSHRTLDDMRKLSEQIKSARALSGESPRLRR